ncbi:MAG: hypothetical protein K1X88_12575 [Nannocystaceae bacterium]|nr:hypothetical protein [Nannocystaceae bacterium]
MRPRRALPYLVGALILALGSSCGLWLDRMAKRVRRQQNRSEPFAIGEDIGTRNHAPKTPARAVVHTAAYDAADGLVAGALQSASTPQRRAQLDALGDALQSRVGDVSREAGGKLIAGVRDELPALRPVLGEMLAGVKSDLHLDPEGTAKRVTRAAFAEVGDGLRTNVRPQVRALVTHDVVEPLREGLQGLLGPELQQRVRDHLVPAIKELTKDAPQTAKTLGHEAAAGLSQGLADSLDPQQAGSLGARIEALFDRTEHSVDQWLSRGLLAALAIAVIALVIAVVKWTSERARGLLAGQARSAAEADRLEHERMLELVATAIHQVGDDARVSDFRRAIKALSPDGEPLRTRAALSAFLTRRKLKLER